MTVPLGTGRWRDVYELIQAGEPLRFTPTRIHWASRGTWHLVARSQRFVS
jgi:hypothetical protein